MPVQGDTLYMSIQVIDNQSEGIEGITFTEGVDYYGYMPDNTAMDLDRVSWTEVGGGEYRFEVITVNPTDPIGQYTLHVRADCAWPQTYTEAWTLETRFNYPTTGGTSRATLRRLILAKFGDLTVLRATQNGGYDYLVDEANLYHEPSAYRGREVIFTAGQAALQGVIRQVSASSRASMAIQFSTNLPVPTMIGDEVEMVNAYGMGVTIQAVHRAIEYAIAIAQPLALIPVSWEPSDVFNGISAWDVTIPDEVVGIESIMWLDDTGEEFALQRGMGQGDAGGWAMNHGRHSISIGGRTGISMRNRSLIINGYVLPEALDHDSDETHIDREWIVNTACAHLCLDVLMSRQASSDWAQRGQQYQNRADVLLSKLTPDIGPTFMRF